MVIKTTLGVADHAGAASVSPQSTAHTRTQRAGMRSFGVRQLAAAFSPASLLARLKFDLLPASLLVGNCARVRIPASQLAGRKAAASCRTPKLRAHAGIAHPTALMVVSSYRDCFLRP